MTIGPHKPSWWIAANSPDSERDRSGWRMRRQEGVKKVGQVSNRYSSMSQDDLRALLNDLIAQRGETLDVFGAVLAGTIGADRPPFSRQYVHRLRTGRDAITERIAAALLVLAAMSDGVNELQARARSVQVLAVHDLPAGVVVLGRPRSCDLSGCRVQFVPASPAQRYCSPECRREAVRRRLQAVG